jgi:hypothetical protein
MLVTSPTNFRQLGSELLFSASDSSGANTLYRIRNGVPESLGQQYIPNGTAQNYEGSLYWSNSFAGALYKYDGNSVTTLLSGISELTLAGFNSDFVVLSGHASTWDTYTWDGTSLRTVSIPSTGPVFSFDRHLGVSNDYFLSSNLTLYKVSLTSAEPVKGMPGNNSVVVDPGTPATVNGITVFKGTGSFGSEVYRLDDNVATLLQDINPNGNAFAFSTSFPVDVQGFLSFIAFNASGTGLYKTDGFSVSKVTDVGPYFAFAVTAVGDLPFVLFDTYTDPSQTISSRIRHLTDGISVADFSSYFPSGEDGQIGSFLVMNGQTYDFTSTGKVYLLTAVPEPGAEILVVSVLCAVRIRRRNRFEELSLESKHGRRDRGR